MDEIELEEYADGYKPTKAMADEARKALEWRAEYGRGGTEIGVARARNIANRDNLSSQTVARMRSFFARHGVNRDKFYDKKEPDGGPTAWRIAWSLWAGDPGRRWAEAIGEREDKKALEESAKKAASELEPIGTEPFNDRKAVGKRIREARKRLGLTLKEVGEAVGVTPQGINQWESGRAAPFGPRLTALCTILEVSSDWITTGKVKKDTFAKEPLVTIAHGGTSIVNRYDWHEILKRHQIPSHSKMRQVTSFPAGSNSYAAKVSDDQNEPLFRKGDIIVVDPDLDWRPGDLVLWLPKENERPILRRYREAMGGKMSLVPLNKDYAEQVVVDEEDGEIIGVVTEHHRRLMRHD